MFLLYIYVFHKDYLIKIPLLYFVILLENYLTQTIFDFPIFAIATFNFTFSLLYCVILLQFWRIGFGPSHKGIYTYFSKVIFCIHHIWYIRTLAAKGLKHIDLLEFPTCRYWKEIAKNTIEIITTLFFPNVIMCYNWINFYVLLELFFIYKNQ